jgi:ribosomal protein L34E
LLLKIISANLKPVKEHVQKNNQKHTGKNHCHGCNYIIYNIKKGFPSKEIRRIFLTTLKE